MELQTIVVYTTLTIVFYSFAKAGKKYNSFGLLITGLLVYTFVFAVRKGVGTDFFTYQHWYNGDSFHEIEVGFQLLMDTLNQFGMPSEVFFGVVAFLQLFFILLAFRRYPEIWPMLVLAFMLSGQWHQYANGLRQWLAFSLFVYSLRFIKESNVVKYYVCIAIASTVHTSALLLVVMYPIFIFKIEWFKSVWGQFLLLVLVVAVALGQMDAINLTLKKIDVLITLLGYDNYVDNWMYMEYMETDVTFGFGVVYLLSRQGFVIYLSNRVKRHINSPFISMIYDLCFFGFLWRWIFVSSMILGRINYYFLGFEFIMEALILYILSLRKKKYLFWIFLCICTVQYFLTLLDMHDNHSLYIFTWQDYPIYKLSNYN